MIPIGGLSLITHSLILFGGYLNKLFFIKISRLKRRFLEFGLKFFPQVSLALLTKDSSLKLIFSCFIVCIILSLSLISAGLSLRFNSEKSTSISSVGGLIQTGLVFAIGRNGGQPADDNKFKEIPFAKEIKDAEPDLTAKSGAI